MIVVISSETGAAMARASAPAMMCFWRHARMAAPTRASSNASLFSILTTRTPSRPSMTAVVSDELSSMALPLAALVVRLEW